MSRISPRKYNPFGSSFQRLTAHRMGFGSRSRVKLDFSSPKKSEVAAAPPITTTTPPTTAVTTPINPEEENTANQSPGINVIVQTPSIESHKGGVKNSNKKLKGNRRNRIVTFDEQQLNQSGSFSSIPIKDLIILAQQQVDKSPKKGTTPLSPQSSPLELYPQPRQKVSNVTAVTIPNDKTTTVSTLSVVTTTTAGVSSLHQQDVGGASSGGITHTGLPVTMTTHTVTNASAVVTTHITTTPAVTTTCVSITTAPATTYINTTRCCSVLNLFFVKIIFSLVFNKTLMLYHHFLFKPDRLKLSSNETRLTIYTVAIVCIVINVYSEKLDPTAIVFFYIC